MSPRQSLDSSHEDLRKKVAVKFASGAVHRRRRRRRMSRRIQRGRRQESGGQGEGGAVWLRKQVRREWRSTEDKLLFMIRVRVRVRVRVADWQPVLTIEGKRRCGI